MCAILGGNNPKWDYENGIKIMKHRGPDGIRVHELGGFTFAFARLAVIDLTSQGMQPMFSLDNQVCIVFNGEIYGYQKLKNILEKRGYLFRSASDTEVVLNAYLEWGEKFIAKVDGMYGIAIYDKRDWKVRLFRDRMGIKPLYYYYDGHNFGFASELKGIMHMCSTVSFEIDNTAVYDYMNYCYIPDPKTYYKNVYKLQPGHRMIFDIRNNKIIKDSSYWRLKVNDCQQQQRKQEDLIEELRFLIRESVQEQIIADVPVGTFLSGGVDSSIVTYEGYQINPRLETFSMGFTKTKYDESYYARQLANKYDLQLNLQVFNSGSLEQHYDSLKKWYDEPFADTSAFPTYIVSKMAKEKVTVVLTGDGGDEVFGGYSRQHQIWQKEKEKGPDHLLISAIYNFYVKNISKTYSNCYFWLDELAFLLQSTVGKRRISDKELRKLLNITKDYDKYWYFRKYYNKGLPPLTRVQYLDLKTYLPGDILTKVDRASMAVSLETRVPFLSKKIVEFSFALSEEDRCPKREKKGLLKKAYEKEFGKKFLYRQKQGFCIPQDYLGYEKSAQELLYEKLWK